MSSRISQRNSFGADANLSRRIQRNIERDPQAGNLKLSNVSFTAPDAIVDAGSGNWSAVYRVGDLVEVCGSVANSRRWRVTAVGASILNVSPPLIVTEGSGPAIVVQRDS